MELDAQRAQHQEGPRDRFEPLDRIALLTVEDVAEMLQVPLSWVYEHTRRRSIDRIPGFRLGKYWRFRKADVLDWVERQRVGSKRNA